VAHYLQHIGKIDRPPEAVIFLHICTFGIFQVFSIYMNFGEAVLWQDNSGFWRI
jgi:hypothetical protein